MRTGVLALQGDVPEHLAAIAQIGAGYHPSTVRGPADLAEIDVLFLPGGESTTIARLLKESGLWEPLVGRLERGLPVLATCAGLILLSRKLAPSPGGLNPPTIARLDVTVRRNDYGTQRESFEDGVRVAEVDGGPFPGVFIRAPRILQVGPQAQPIAWRGSEVVGVRQGSVWGLTFHPELSGDPRVHACFLRDAERTLASRSGRPARVSP
jgi:pyridoxal 5'-phosphate synthase pdxT subunit